MQAERDQRKHTGAEEAMQRAKAAARAKMRAKSQKHHGRGNGGKGNACSAEFIVYLNCEPFNIDLAAWGTAAGSRVWLTAITF